MITTEVLERVRAFVDTSAGPSSCHPWTGAKTRAYGSTSLEGVSVPAHRVLYCGEKGLPYNFPGVVRHVICHNPICCNVAHLAHGTRADNQADMVRDGRSTRGERHPMRKLREVDVFAIRTDSRPARDLASEYGISVGQVQRIKSRRSWSWL